MSDRVHLARLSFTSSFLILFEVFEILIVRYVYSILFYSYLSHFAYGIGRPILSLHPICGSIYPSIRGMYPLNTLPRGLHFK